MFHAEHSLPLSQTKFSPQIATSHLGKCKTTSITFANPSLLRYDRLVSRGSLAPGGPPLPYHVHEASSPFGEEPSNPESPFPTLSQLLYMDSWKGLVIGVFLSLILPFWGSRLGPLLKIKNEVETVVEVADIAAEVTEFVAEEVEEVAENAADKIPEGGKFKGVATSIEMAAKVTAKDAQLAEEFLDKVKEVEEEVDSFLGDEEEDPIDSAIEKAEEIAEVVEKVAEGVEKAAEEVPDGGKLKAAATLIEKAAKETAKDAHRVEEIAVKAEEAKEEVETVIYGKGKLERIIRAIKRRKT